MKAEADRLNINKLVNVTTGLNNLKTLVDDLDVGKLKNIPIDKKKENSWWNYFNLHESIENRKKNWRKKLDILIKNIPEVSGLVPTTVLKDDSMV